MKMSEKHLHILLVDDDADDVELFREVIDEFKLGLRISEANNGETAFSLLRVWANEPKPDLPDLILLDLNMPKQNGLELLAEIRNTEALKVIPVIVFSSSRSAYDIQESYQRGANCYIVKPMGINELRQVIRVLNDFWFSIVEFPTKR